MDPISFTVGIVGLTGLFSVCLDVIDKVDSYKDFGSDARAIVTQYEAYRHLFTRWARDVGISEDTPNESHHRNLDNPATCLIVQKVLSGIQEIFGKTERTFSDLQPMVGAGPTSFPDGIRFLDKRQKTQKLHGVISQRSRIGWSLRSKAKFMSQVQQFGSFVRTLQDLVPPDGLAVSGNPQKVISSDSLGGEDQRVLIEMEKQIEREMRKELDIWLGASWTNDVYDDYVRRRLDGTCDWILIQHAFLDWLSSDFPSGNAKILWINGPAGHGKTILCARVVQYLLTVFESPLAYYFCSSDSEIRRDPISIIRSWVSQIVSSNQDAFEWASEKWETKDGRHASQTDITDLFQLIVQSIPNCIFVADGLDECVWQEDPTNFFESIQRATATTNSRILFFSRDEPEIRSGFRAIWTSYEDHGLNEYRICSKDVRPDTILFSRSVVDKKLADKSETLKDELSQRMADRCEGMFLWVKMLEEQLRSWKNKKQLEITIDQAPTALEHLYDRNWAKILDLPDKDRLRAFSILRWATFALRPLTILELTEALLIVDEDCEDLSVDELPDAIDEDYVNSEILGLCGSLLETRKAAPEQDLGSMTIHLAHFSVKQYILYNIPAQEGLPMANIRLRASNETFQSNILAKLCLRYLNLRSVAQESHQLQGELKIRPLRNYAAGLWNQHIKEHGSNYKEVVDLSNALFNPITGKWESWKRWFDVNDDSSELPEFQRKSTSTNPLFYTSLLGLRDTVIYLLEEKNLAVNYTDEFGRTALHAAALKGQSSIVKLLLEKGANVAAASKDGLTPLYLASTNGHIKVVRLLLEQGADMKVVSYKGLAPLNLASNSGYIEVVKLLLERGADMTVANNRGWTPLNSASDRGHIEIVKLLLERGADITVANIEGWTPLNSASESGHIEVVKLLLERGADMTVANIEGWTPLNSASNRGHIEIVKLLLERGADMTVANIKGWTPLISASDRGHIEIVKLLLERGADMTVANIKGWTPLNSASESGYIEVVKLLLERGADMTVANIKGWTPLNSASDSGHIEVVKLLLERGADITVASHRGWTPLNSASDSGHIEVVKLLLERGADMTVADIEGWTPLNSASESGHIEVVKLLLERGADMTVANNRGWTCLISASDRGHIEVVKLLLEQGADMTVANNKGWTCLISALDRGHIEIVKLLLERGADIETKDNVYRTPLLYAAKNGNEAIIKFLLATKRVDVDSKDYYNSTPLSIASRMGHKDVVAFLLTESRSLNSQDIFGRTALWWARRTGYPEIADLLLQKHKEEGIIVQEDDLPMAKILVPRNNSSRYCDVCVLCMSKEDNYYHCEVCHYGDFDICKECFAMKAHCLDEHHTLIEK